MGCCSLKRSIKDGICEVDCFDPAKVRAARHALPTLETLREAAGLFAALGHPTRLKIVKALETAELCVCDIAQVTELSISAVSHQLKELRNAGIVSFRTEGKLAYYTVAGDFWLRTIEAALEHSGSRGALRE